MLNRIELAYTSLAKVVLASLGLSIVGYVSSGFLSEIFFECVQLSTLDFGTTAQLCEMYRPFFLLELLTSKSADVVLVWTAVFSFLMLVSAVIWNRALMRELGILGVSALIVFLSYRYFSARTLLLADFSNQKSSGLLRSVEFEIKCPWRGWSCIGSDKISAEGTTLPRRP